MRVPGVARGRQSVLSGVILTLALLAMAVGVLHAATAGSSRSGVYDVTSREHEASSVRLSWEYGGDEPDAFEVYRSVNPMTLDDATASTLVTSAASGTRSVLVAPASDEASSAFEFYYAVVWSTGGQRFISSNVSPNPHGAAAGDNVSSCDICHDPHAPVSKSSALGAGGTGVCYSCHGSTTETRAYGLGAATDVQAAFYDEAPSPLPPSGSRHRNAAMVSSEQECTGCHTPHRRPFSVLPQLGFPKLLRTGTGAVGGWTYATAAAPFGNDFCLGCHGASTSLMAAVGGAGASDASGGDHGTGYANSAHSPADVPATPGAATQCQVCHAEHASPVAALIDYRGSSTEGTGNAESGLCFKCHSAQTSKGVEADRGAGKPYTWNGRDVWSEFSATSRHPYLSTGGSLSVRSDTAMLLDSKDEFDAAALVNVVTWTDTEGTGSPDYAALVWNSAVLHDYLPQNLGYVSGMVSGYGIGGLHTFEGASFDSKGFDPPDPTETGSGSTSLNVAGSLYITRGVSGGTGTTTRWMYTPPSNSGVGVLSAASPTPSPIGVGSDADWDSAHDVAFYTAGGGSSSIMRWRHTTDTWLTGIRFSVAGVETGLGIGSTIAYSPQADRLFVINRNGVTGDGRLYYLDSPSTVSGLTDFTSTGLQVTLSSATPAYNRMARVTTGGNDYIYVIGTTAGNAGKTQLVDSLAGTPKLREAPGFPFNWGYYEVYDGGALEWDGAGTLYAIQGGGHPDLSWRAVPADPVADAVTDRGWNEWGYYNDWYSYPVGTSMAFAQTDPAPFTAPGYPSEGSLTTGQYVPGSGVYRLGDVLLNSGTGTYSSVLQVDVQGLRDAVWSDVPGYTGLSGATISVRGIDIHAWDAFRLVVHLYSPLHTVSPSVYRVGLTTEYEALVAGGSLTCANCHNAHQVGKGTGVWDLSRVSDPDDTRKAFTGTPTQFCLRCHDGSPPKATATAAAFIPYTVVFSDMTSSPAFPGWDKTTPGAAFQSSAHATTSGTKAECATCHDPHGSSNGSLLAWTRPAGFSTGTIGARDNTSTAARGSNLCLQCHGNGTLGRSAPGAPDVATKVSLLYGHSVATFIGTHSDRELPLTQATAHVECVDCHDPHAARAGTHTIGTSEAGPALQGAVGSAPTWSTTRWTTATSYAATRTIGAGGYEAYVCLRCHSAQASMNLRYTITPDPTVGGSKTYYYETDLSKEFNPANQSGHNIVGSRSSWPKETIADGLAASWTFPTDAVAFRSGSGFTKDSQLTCTDCHTSPAGGASGPHGSTYQFGLVADGVYDTNLGMYRRWYQTRLDEWNTTFLCGRCHLKGSNKIHRMISHSQYTCASCHVAIPHGWQLPRLLREGGLPATNIAPYSRDTSHKITPTDAYTWKGTLQKFSDQAHTPEGWTGASCAGDYCHGDPLSGTPWAP